MQRQGNEQQEDRKIVLRKTFDTVAEGYDNRTLRFFSESARHIAGYLGLTGHEHVLDVATGTGHAALALAARLPEGTVTGIDFSEGMLSQARTKAAALRIHNVQFLAMDMQALDFPDNHFDAAVSAFGLFFVDDMDTQLRHIMKKVKPGAKVLITSFHGRPFLPLSEMFFEQLKDYGVVIDPQTLKRLSTKEECTALLHAAGLKDIAVHEKNVGYYLESADQWWDVIWNAGFRRYVQNLPPQSLERFKEDHLLEVGELSTDDGIWLDVNVLYSIGVKP